MDEKQQKTFAIMADILLSYKEKHAAYYADKPNEEMRMFATIINGVIGEKHIQGSPIDLIFGGVPDIDSVSMSLSLVTFIVELLGTQPFISTEQKAKVLTACLRGMEKTFGIDVEEMLRATRPKDNSNPFNVDLDFDLGGS